jgi:predicted nucleic acid-binding protein
VTLILDAAPLVAFADRRDPDHSAVADTLERERGGLVVPAPVTAEVDYLLGVRLGEVARRAFLDDLAAGTFTVECLDPEDYPDVVALERQYADLAPGLADLSVVVLARRFGSRRILTFDERHFRAIRPLQGGCFQLLPRDR